MLPIRRFRHWRAKAENSISAIFSHDPCLGVKPVFGRKMEHQFTAQQAGLFKGQMLIKGSVLVGVQIVLHQIDPLGMGVMG